MAESPAHRLGQIIGDALEAALQPSLAAFCAAHGFFLDSKGVRPARPGVRLTWTDVNKSTHDLDFVIERDGTDSRKGQPVAFIETAWRRYTKHSKNKAQEIQGAIDPLVEAFPFTTIFKGAVLAGEFTSASLRQLRGDGFCVVYFDYASVVDAFESVGLDVETIESMPDREVAAKVKKCEANPRAVARAGKVLYEAYRDEVDEFIQALRSKLIRNVSHVSVIPLFGDAFVFASITDALAALDEIVGVGASRSLAGRGFEVTVEYGAGEDVKGHFKDVSGVRRFLQQVA